MAKIIDLKEVDGVYVFDQEVDSDETAKPDSVFEGTQRIPHKKHYAINKDHGVASKSEGSAMKDVVAGFNEGMDMIDSIVDIMKRIGR